MCKHILINQFNPKTDFDVLINFNRLTFDNDGFGAIMRTKDNTIETLKSLDKAEFYIELMRRLFVGYIASIVVHHRTSTNERGIDYAHPFEFQGNWLTHNGVVSVPDKHNTKTKNDSEQLLHHFIKTNYDTESVSGYFSCFILNHETTGVIVDATASMYGNGRIFSSHKLGNDFDLISCRHLLFDIDGRQISDNPIKVSESKYGMDKAWLSLGGGYSYGDAYAYDNPSDYFDDDMTKNALDFLSFITQSEEQELLYARSKQEFMSILKDLSYAIGVKLSRPEMLQIYNAYTYPKERDNERFYA